MSSLREPPPKGSVREFVLSLFVLQRHMLEVAKVRALALVALDPKQGIEALRDYFKDAMPWNERAKKQEAQQAQQVLRDFVAGGALTITPSADPRNMRSQLRNKVVQREETREAWEKKAGSALRRIGPLVPKEKP